MTGEFKQSHDANYGEELEDVRVFQVGCELLKHQIYVEAESGDRVDDVDGRLDEFPLVGRRDEPDEELEREPGVADALDVEEGLVGVGLSLVQCPRRSVVRSVDGDVPDDGNAHVRVSLQAERQDRHADEENGDHAYDLQHRQNALFVHRVLQSFR